jgi:hypothetical protein
MPHLEHIKAISQEFRPVVLDIEPKKIYIFHSSWLARSLDSGNI